MNATPGKTPVGCLYIDTITPGKDAASGLPLFLGLPGIGTRPFRCLDGKKLWDGLQTALLASRSRCETVAIAARGTGCAAALALAEQLPVDRLVLVEPKLSLRGLQREGSKADADRVASSRQARRIMAYARRNLSLCVSDVLLIESGNGDRAFPDAALSVHGTVRHLFVDGKTRRDLYTIRENAVKPAISWFLHTGELPKPLAENPEMCIING